VIAARQDVLKISPVNVAALEMQQLHQMSLLVIQLLS
jgi:hypothetical protein